MTGYRVVAAGHEHDAFSGTGAFLFGGRWSTPGARMVYASTHLGLAALEILVHTRKRSFFESRVAIRFEIDDAAVRRLHPSSLPAGWDAIPAPAAAQWLGDEWLRSGESLGLVVPTAVLPHGIELEEQNILLNPTVPEFASRIRNIASFPFRFDDRIDHLMRPDA